MLNLKELEKLQEVQTEYRKKCKNCGHTRLLGMNDKIICNHCGNYIFKDDKAEFEYRLKECKAKQKKGE